MPECGLLHRESSSLSSPVLPPCPSDTTPESHLENRRPRVSELCVTEQPLTQSWRRSPCVHSGAARRHGLRGVKKDFSVVQGARRPEHTGETVVSADSGRRKCMCFHGPEHAPGLVCVTAAQGIQSCGTEPGFRGLQLTLSCILDCVWVESL